MSDAQRSQMIRGMVQRLSDQLHAPEGGSDDIAGWMRLVRAYVVLGDRAKARDAAADARRALASHPAEVNQIDELVKGLGLEG
jgi:cytochrome c-type biogenesis protein CcmH